jgi:hypothetical protein
MFTFSVLNWFNFRALDALAEFSGLGILNAKNLI